MSRLEKLDRFAKELKEDHPDVNYGGCGVVASRAAPLLAKHFYDVAIRRQNGGGHYYVEFRRRPNGRLFSFEAGGVHIGPPKGREPDAEMSFDEMLEQANDPMQWNSDFDRDEIPDIEAALDIFFSVLGPQQQKLFNKEAA